MNEPLAVREASASYVLEAQFAIRKGYKQTEVGVIPEDWEEVSLYELAGRMKDRFDDGDWIEAKFLTEAGIRLIQTGNIGVGIFIDKETKKYISSQSFDLLRCKALREGDLLICRLAEPAGRACLFPNLEDDRTITAVDVTIFRPLEELADRRYLLQQFNTLAWFDAVNERCGGSTRTRIARGALGKIKIPLPPTKVEQEAIAEALSDADGLIASLEQLIAKKRHLKQGAMQELLTGKKRLPGFGGEWERIKAGDIGKFSGGSGFPIRFQGTMTGEYPFFKVSDMNNAGNEIFMGTANNYISEAMRKQLGATAFPAESIVFAKVGAAVFLERKKILRKASCLDNNMAAFVMDASRAHSRFIHYVLLNTKLGSLVSTTALPSLSGSVLSAIELLLPSLPEQTAIATILTDMDAEIAALETQLAKARGIKQGMMQELLTGRIRLV